MAFSAQRLYALEQDKSLGLGCMCSITEETAKPLADFLDTVKRIKPTEDDEVWSFWVDAPRGNITDFGDFNELYENGEYDTYEEFERDWLEWFPKDTYWYEITVASRNGYVAININNTTVLNYDPQCTSFDKRDLVDLLLFLTSKLKEIISELETGRYAETIDEKIPAEYKTGYIDQQRLWEISPKIKEYMQAGLTLDEISQFADYIHSSELKRVLEETDRIKTMTATNYFEICALCYKAAHYENCDNRTAKELYTRFADERDGGLSAIDADSSEAFDAWYALDNQAKWDIHNASHLWEISAGSTHTRIKLYVSKDEKGYFLSLYGGVYSCTEDVIRMYNVLKEKGLPVVLYDCVTIRNKILGLGEVGIVPIQCSISKYWYSQFPRDGIVSFIKLDNEDLSQKEVGEIIKSASWFSVANLSLAEQ